MATGKGFLPVVTLILIALNGLVYLAMGLNGVSWTEPSIAHAIRWGADFGPMTLNGQWWRILTSTFVHFGIIHIAFNMWCLYSLGVSLEMFMGRKTFALVYVLSGLAASLVSIGWNPWRTSAGASGAIFGIAGAFVSFLYFKKAPMAKDQVKQKLKSLLIFVGYNLLRGAGGNVDNSAHIGGLIAGLILGALVPVIVLQAEPSTSVADSASTAPPPALPAGPIELPSERESRVNRMTWQIAAGGLVILMIAAGWIRGRNAGAIHYGNAIALVQAGKLDQGASEMERALSVDSSLILANALLGELRLEQGNPSAAIPVFERTLTLVPNAVSIEHNLALAYLGSGRSADAMKEIASAIQIEKSGDWRAQYILALAAEQYGDSRLALESLKSVIQSNPDFKDAHEAFARIGSSGVRGNVIAIPYSKLAFKSEAWPIYP